MIFFFFKENPNSQEAFRMKGLEFQPQLNVYIHGFEGNGGPLMVLDGEHPHSCWYSSFSRLSIPLLALFLSSTVCFPLN
eukprot:c35463_g1_i1 orf=42-278(-)